MDGFRVYIGVCSGGIFPCVQHVLGGFEGSTSPQALANAWGHREGAPIIILLSREFAAQ